MAEFKKIETTLAKEEMKLNQSLDRSYAKEEAKLNPLKKIHHIKKVEKLGNMTGMKEKVGIAFPIEENSTMLSAREDYHDATDFVKKDNDTNVQQDLHIKDGNISKINDLDDTEIDESFHDLLDEINPELIPSPAKQNKVRSKYQRIHRRLNRDIYYFWKHPEWAKQLMHRIEGKASAMTFQHKMKLSQELNDRFAATLDKFGINFDHSHVSDKEIDILFSVQFFPEPGKK